MQKAQGEINHVISTTATEAPKEGGDTPQVVIHEDGTVMSGAQESAPSNSDDNASTRVMVSPTMKPSSSTDINGSSLDTTGVIPTIRVSTESDRDLEEDIAINDLPPVNGETELNRLGDVDTLEKPVQAAAGEEEQGDGERSPSQEPFSFSNKRLCERWLDNLFMVLYEVTLNTSSNDCRLTFRRLGSASVDDI